MTSSSHISRYILDLPLPSSLRFFRDIKYREELSTRLSLVANPSLWILNKH